MIGLNIKSKKNFLKLYRDIPAKKEKAIRFLEKLIKNESTPSNPYFIIPKENDHRIDTNIK